MSLGFHAAATLPCNLYPYVLDISIQNFLRVTLVSVVIKPQGKG
jgi:hypothetical protein